MKNTIGLLILTMAICGFTGESAKGAEPAPSTTRAVNAFGRAFESYERQVTEYIKLQESLIAKTIAQVDWRSSPQEMTMKANMETAIANAKFQLQRIRAAATEYLTYKDSTPRQELLGAIRMDRSSFLTNAAPTTEQQNLLNAMKISGNLLDSRATKMVEVVEKNKFRDGFQGRTWPWETERGSINPKLLKGMGIGVVAAAIATPFLVKKARAHFAKPHSTNEPAVTLSHTKNFAIGGTPDSSVNPPSAQAEGAR